MTTSQTFAPRRPWWKRLLGVSDKQLAERLLNDLLTNKMPAEIASLQVSPVVLEAGLSAKQTRQLLTGYYRKLLSAAAQDRLITDDEQSQLEAIRVALSISDSEIKQIEKEILHPTLRKNVEIALDDRELSESEKKSLKQLASDLRLSEETLTALTQAKAQEILQAEADTVLSTKRYSPQDETMLTQLARNLGGRLELDASSKRLLNKYRLLWEIDNGQIPEVAADISLFKGERCYSQTMADWYELRTKTTSVSYHGPSVSIRIAKGVRYRLGNVTPIRHTKEELTRLDSGTLYITDRRIIFKGTKKNTTLRYSALLGFTPYSDGIELERSSGRSPVIIVNGTDIDVLHATLAAAMSSELE
jgi:DnaJ-domain-containing protein 1